MKLVWNEKRSEWIFFPYQLITPKDPLSSRTLTTPHHPAGNLHQRRIAPHWSLSHQHTNESLARGQTILPNRQQNQLQTKFKSKIHHTMSSQSVKFIRRIPSQTHSIPFRIPPSSQTSTTKSLSSRALSSHLRSQTHHSAVRSAVACEASSLRYALLLSGEGETALLRGWDGGVADEEDDGTWVLLPCEWMLWFWCIVGWFCSPLVDSPIF